MKTVKVLFICVIALLLVAQAGIAQDRKAGVTGATFLKIPVGAREAALGGAVTGIPNDINQMFYNPAGIILKDKMIEATFNYNKWIADLGHNSAAVTYNWQDVGTIGVGFITFGVSDIPASRDIFSDPVLAQQQTDHNTSDTYNYRDIAYQVSFARQVMDNFSLGVTVKGVSESIDGTSVSAFAVDFGSLYNIGVLDWTIAARFNNLGSDMKYYDIAFGLPLSFSIGTAIVPYKIDNNKVMLALDAVKSQDGPQYFFGGMEVSLMDMIALRGGYKFNYIHTNDGGTSSRAPLGNTIEGLSLGAGVQTTFQDYGIGIDYAFSKMDLLDSVHRFTVRISMK